MVSVLFLTLPKITFVFLLVKLFSGVFYTLLPFCGWLFFLFGLFSSFFGAFFGIFQTKIRRLLAYSGISNLGYIFVIFSIFSSFSFYFILLYIVVYIFLTLIFFSFFFSLKKVNNPFSPFFEDIKDYTSLYSNHPFIGYHVCVFIIFLYWFAAFFWVSK